MSKGYDKKVDAIKERYEEAQEATSEQDRRMLEDLRFSNPANPQQWEDNVRTVRKNRPCLTFDRTNQFINQVVNDARQNKPAMVAMPADSYADPEAAKVVEGMFRHIEYVSRAHIAYDTAMEYAARAGLGWVRVVPEIVDTELNLQEIRIKRVHDIFSVKLDPNSTEPDGQDALWGQVETTYTTRAFKRRWPKAEVMSFDMDGWFSGDTVRVVEDFYIDEVVQNRISVQIDGEVMTLSEKEYWDVCQKVGFTIPVKGTFKAKVRKQLWRHVSGCEILEETEFPSKYVPLVPVMGHEIWIEGKRYLCGMTRRLMDSQRAYNYERSAYVEAVATQPKAPIMAAIEAIEGHENAWRGMATGNPSYLPFNAFDDNGNAIPIPQRQAPPAFPVTFAQGGQIASSDMESAIGMHKANLGQTTNEVSGKAILARQREGDTANFHYTDNMARTVEQLGRIILDMIPRVYDTKRQEKIMGVDDKVSTVTIDNTMPQPVQKQGKKIVAVNLNLGTYDIRTKSGPSFISQRQESVAQLTDLLAKAPDLMTVIGDIYVKMQDWPEADKVARRMRAIQPPEIRAADGEDDEDDGAQMAAKMAQMQKQIQAMEEAGTKLQEELKKLNKQTEEAVSKAHTAEARAEIERIQRTKAEGLLALFKAQQAGIDKVQGIVDQINADEESHSTGSVS